MEFFEIFVINFVKWTTIIDSDILIWKLEINILDVYIYIYVNV